MVTREPTKKQSILVTGSTGFIGLHLCKKLLINDFNVRGSFSVERSGSQLPPGVHGSQTQPVGLDTNWSAALDGIDTVIHLTARVHVMDDPSADPLTEFRKVNVAGTTRLAREAAKAGVKRMLFVSSIKVNGEESSSPFTPASLPAPSDAYGISKWEAELALRTIETETGMEVVIIRPPLVYGPRVKANFLNLMKFIEKGIPLPFASLVNQRSMIYVGNLVDALTICAVHPNAAGQTYLVSDGEDVSTPELIRRAAAALGVPARLFPVPVSLLRLAGHAAGKVNSMSRLTGSLSVDTAKIRLELGWVPPFTMEEGLMATAEWFKLQWK